MHVLKKKEAFVEEGMYRAVFNRINGRSSRFTDVYSALTCLHNIDFKDSVILK